MFWVKASCFHHKYYNVSTCVISSYLWWRNGEFYHVIWVKYLQTEISIETYQKNIDNLS